MHGLRPTEPSTEINANAFPCIANANSQQLTHSSEVREIIFTVVGQHKWRLGLKDDPEKRVSTNIIPTVQWRQGGWKVAVRKLLLLTI